MGTSSVFLSHRAFDRARREGILDIQPNAEQMFAVGELTGTGEAYLPDITILRDHGSFGNWDVTFKDAPSDTPYRPASDLEIEGRGLLVASALSLQQHRQATGKKLVELTVRDWDKLGERLVEAIEEGRTLGKGHPERGADLVTNALGWAASQLLGQPSLDSPARARIRTARTLQPYTISRQTSR